MKEFMKTFPFFSLATIILVSVVTFSVRGQGTFQNLNFELANPGPLTQNPDGPPYAINVPVADALPYWIVFYGSVQQSEVNVNAPSLGSPAVTLIAPGDNPIDGNYSVLLQGFGQNVSISQTGLVPFTAQSLFFEAQSSDGPLIVSIGGQSVPFSAISTGPNYVLYGANISAWAGETESLQFTAASLPNEADNWELDDIAFSAQSVPEPDAFLLTGLGGTLFALYRRFAPKRK